MTAMALTSGLLVGQVVTVPAAHASDKPTCAVAAAAAVVGRSTCAFAPRSGTVFLDSTLNEESGWNLNWYPGGNPTTCGCDFVTINGDYGSSSGAIGVSTDGWTQLQVYGGGAASGRVVISLR